MRMRVVAKKILILVAFGFLPIWMWLPGLLHPDIWEFGLLALLLPAPACLLTFPLAFAVAEWMTRSNPSWTHADPGLSSREMIPVFLFYLGIALFFLWLAVRPFFY
jgi:hypothetical protein